MSDQITQISAATEPGVKPRRFTIKQRLFIDFYLGVANFNGAEAARLAGYSERTAKVQAYENLTKPHLLREIERRLEIIGLSEGEIRSRLGQMARGEVSTKTVTKGDETTEIYDKRQALEDAARIQGLLIDRHQIQPVQALLIEDAD